MDLINKEIFRQDSKASSRSSSSQHSPSLSPMHQDKKLMKQDLKKLDR